MAENALYFGDNLDVLRRYINDASVDLIYLDPPFNSKQDYNVLFKEVSGLGAAAQIKAFGDTWHWDQSAAAAFQEIVEEGGRVSQTMQAFQMVLGENDMLAYLSMMAPRLVELHRVLKPTGSIYLHCDATASHYLKLLMDAVFSPANYRNEIIWKRYGAHNDVAQGSQHFGRVHDAILFYTGSESVTWHQQYTPLDPDYVKAMYRGVEPETGRRYRTKPLTAPGGAGKGNPEYEWKGHTRFWRYSKETMERLDSEGLLYYSKTGYVSQKHYLDSSKGVPVQDLWTDIPGLTGTNVERLGYPTQKPEKLLERIIEASSNEGDVVLDPFCGCGTAISVAQRLNRKWVGIDITHLAISLMKHRLKDAFGEAVKYKVVGEPTALEDARALALEDRYNFQFWALGLVGARPTEEKKGADKGIDGRLYFHDEKGKTKQVIFSVKSGKLKSEYVREMPGVINRERAQIGVVITLEEPTALMRTEASTHGFYDSPVWNTRHPRIQIITIRELLEGKKVDMPPVQHVNTTFRKAPKANTKDGGTVLGLFGEGEK